MVILTVLTVCTALRFAEADKRIKEDTNDAERLAAAAKSCDMPTLKALIASGTDLAATDAKGYDALSHASLNRRTKGVESWGTLKCPAAVAALTAAGADPWKARFYQSPRLEENRPELIALISVKDDRKEKGESEKLVKEVTDAIENYLHAHHGPGLKYPILRLNDVRQKLLASGFSAEEAMAPDRIKACRALGVDSVLESSLGDYRSSNILVAQAAGMTMKVALTDCKNSDLLFHTDRDYNFSEGWLRALSGNKIKQMIEDPTGPLAFPCYDGRKKKG